MSLFAGGGIGETYLDDIGITTVVANELLPERARIYTHRFPDTKMIIGDIKEHKKELIDTAKKEDVKLLIATPPCQGMSNLGQRNYDTDIRNFLIFDVLDIIDNLDLDYIFIENVPKFLNMYYPYKNNVMNIIDIFNEKYGEKYNIEHGVYNAADYSVPQIRKRALIRIYKKGLKWDEPTKEKHITLREAIGHLPIVESGENSGIPFHFGPKHSAKHIETIKHTPSGCSAYDNPVYYPKRDDGQRVKGYHNTYTRLSWDKVCPTRTMNSGTISGSNNCHPGRLLKDGTYSDARVLTLLELFIVSSLPQDMSFPENTTEKQIRAIVGEGIPPLMSKAFLEKIINNS